MTWCIFDYWEFVLFWVYFFFAFHPTQAAQPLELSNSSVPKVFEKQCITSNWKLSLRSNRAWRLWPGTTSQSLQARKKREARSDSTACFKCKQIVQPSSELLCTYDRSDRYFLSRRRLISSFFNFSCLNSVLTLVFCEILNYIASAAAKFRYFRCRFTLKSLRNSKLWSLTSAPATEPQQWRINTIAPCQLVITCVSPSFSFSFLFCRIKIPMWSSTTLQ